MTGHVVRLFSEAAGCGGRVAACLSLLASAIVSGQTSNTEAGRLIGSLTHQGADPTSLARLGLSSCGQINADHAIVNSIIALGESAIPDLEVAMSSIASRNQDSESALNAGELLEAYARIEGRRGTVRLMQMLADPKLAFLQPGLDRAIGISMALTSYISSGEVWTERFHCAGGQEPKDALDRLILAWERNDRKSIEVVLGPHAMVSFNGLRDKTRWDNLRNQLWRFADNEHVAVGYKLEARSYSAQDKSRPSDMQGGTSHPTSSYPLTFSLRLRSALGNECTRFDLVFVRGRQGFNQSRYLVDNANIKELFQAISSCAAVDTVGASRRCNDCIK